MTIKFDSINLDIHELLHEGLESLVKRSEQNHVHQQKCTGEQSQDKQTISTAL